MPALNFQPGLSNWTMGVATATNGSATVTFVNAGLTAADVTNPAVTVYVAGEGDQFIVPGVGSASIRSVDSANQITLDFPWPFATQAGVAYRIRRYREVKTGEVAKHIQDAQTRGQDTNPFASLVSDDGVARVKTRSATGLAEFAVGPTGALDAALKSALQIDPATGAVSAPNGLILPAGIGKNRIVNGAFDIWTRGANFAVANSTIAFAADRFRVTNNFGVVANVTKVAAPAGFLGANALNIQATGATAGASLVVGQRLEARALADCDSVACVASFDVSASTSAGALTGFFQILANTAVDNGAYATSTAYIPFTIPVGAKRVSVLIPAANTAGLKYGAELRLVFVQNTAVGNPNITIGAVQFEQGAVATPFEFRQLTIEEVLCRRTKLRIPLPTGTVRDAYFGSASNFIWTIPFAPMRAPPTVMLSGLTASNAASPSIAVVNGMAAITWPVSAAGRVYVNAAAGAYIDLDAEL